MEELIERVKASEKTKSIWRGNTSSTEWREASQLNKLLTGIPLNGSAKCECIEDLFFLLKRENVNDKIKENMSKRFILKKGKLIQSANFGIIGETSSDEKMIELLKNSPAHIKFFKSVPENWEEICGIEKAKAGSIKGSVEMEIEEIEDEPLIEENTKGVEGINAIEEETTQEQPATEEIEETQASVKLDKDELSKLKVSQLMNLLNENGVEIPKDVIRKPELIELILQKL